MDQRRVMERFVIVCETENLRDEGNSYTRFLSVQSRG
jgi:hypothetical protein